MAVRAPQSLGQHKSDNPLEAALEYEIIAEKAATLSRLNKALETALDRIPAEDLQAGSEAQTLRALRQAEAGEALWHVMIQRELCGLTSHKAFFDHMGVPAKVRLQAGPVPAHLKAANRTR